MDKTILGQIDALRRMTVGELRDEWQRLYGEATRSRNREYLYRRLAWRLQELQHGGLSDRARARIAELAPEGFVRRRTPVSPLDAESSVSPRTRRVPRLPAPGSVITKIYKGRELRVVVHDGGFEYDGAMYVSLTAIAKCVTGSKNINGRLFFGLTKRSRKS